MPSIDHFKQSGVWRLASGRFGHRLSGHIGVPVYSYTLDGSQFSSRLTIHESSYSSLITLVVRLLKSGDIGEPDAKGKGQGKAAKFRCQVSLMLHH